MPNIVVIGAGMAGASTARELAKKLPEDYTIVVVEGSQVAFWPPAALRAAVVPDQNWETEVVLKYDKFWPKDSRHKLLSSTRVEWLEPQAVVLESGEKIEFEYAVLATGARYAFPFRAGHPLSGGEATYDATVSGLQSLQEAVKQAKHILVIGGGTVGTEFAGEVGAYYRSQLDVGAKKVTLVSRSEALCGTEYGSALPRKLASQLKQMKVQLLLGDSIDVESLPERQSPVGLEGIGPVNPTTIVTAKGTELKDVDFILVSLGPDANTPLVEKAAPGQVSRAGIEPDGHLRLSGPLSNYFTLGDAADLTSLGVAKMIVPIGSHAGVVSQNIVSLVKAKQAGKPEESVQLKSASAPPKVIIVTMGPRGGSFATPFWTFGEWIASTIKSRSLFISNFKSTFVSN